MKSKDQSVLCKGNLSQCCGIHAQRFTFHTTPAERGTCLQPQIEDISIYFCRRQMRFWNLFRLPKPFKRTMMKCRQNSNTPNKTCICVVTVTDNNHTMSGNESWAYIISSSKNWLQQEENFITLQQENQVATRDWRMVLHVYKSLDHKIMLTAST